MKTTYDDVIIKKTCKSPDSTKQKWKNDIDINENMWPYLFTIASKCTLDIPSRSFQFLLLHRRIPTNKFAHRIGIADSPNCSLCKKHEETIVHLFYECEYVKHFWDQVMGYNIFDSDPLNYSAGETIHL